MKFTDKLNKYKSRLHYFIPYHMILTSLKLFNHVKWMAIKKDSVVLKGHKFHIEENDAGLSKDLILNIKREELSEELLKDIKSDDTIVDLGANIGFYVVKEAEIVKEGKIYAVEPVARNVAVLRKNTEEFDNVKVLQLAIGDSNGTEHIYVHNKLNWCGFEKHPDSDPNRTQPVEMKTLDKLVEDEQIKPNLIRMDVEGYEYNVIKGGQNSLKKYKPRLMMEIHSRVMGEKKTREFLQILRGLNYEITAMVIDNLFYPNMSMSNPVYGTQLWLYKNYSFAKENSIVDAIGKVTSEIKIDDLLLNEQFLKGETPCVHVLLEVN